MTTPTPDLAELRRLAEAATPGPWRTEYLMGAGNDLLTAIIAGRATPDDLRVIGSTLAERDGKFVAAASLLVGVAAILLPNSVVVLALGGLVARGLYGLILGGES